MVRDQDDIELSSPVDAKDVSQPREEHAVGVLVIEATMAIWGRKGKRLVITGLAVLMLL